MKFINILYGLLFIYVIAALLFWGQSLMRQSNTIFQLETHILKDEVDSVRFRGQYTKGRQAIQLQAQKRAQQYFGEGATFLLVILIGAGVVYSSIRRNHKLNEQQNNFMLSITHELKSPIAAVKLNLQTMDRRVLPDDVKHKLIGGSVSEMNRLNDLCNNLLLASRIESKKFAQVAENINVAELMAESLITFNERSNHIFITDLPEKSIIEGDRLLIQLALHNIIENATKYSPADSAIYLTLKNEENEAVISVKDEGPGISDEEKSRIFQKFYRVGNENSRKTKGTGLGLYLTAQIIKMHKGTIMVLGNKPKGTVFEIRFPLVS